MILDTNGWDNAFPAIDNLVITVTELNWSVTRETYGCYESFDGSRAHNYGGLNSQVDIRGFIIPGREYKLVASRCHLCFAPLVKEGSERERDLKTGRWEERATGEYACGTTVAFEPDKKMAVTPGAKVRVGSKCVKLLKKK